MTETLHDRIDIRISDLGTNYSRASLAAGLSKEYLRTMMDRRSTPSLRTLEKLATGLQTTTQWLLRGEGDKAAPEPKQGDAPATIAAPRVSPPGQPQASQRTLPVFGLAAGAPLGNHTMSNDPVEYVPAPPALQSVRDAYVLIVTGDSMEPRYFAGEPIFIHPHRPIRKGDHVAIQEEVDGGISVSVKIFDRQTDEHLVTRQYNPPAEVKFLRKRIQAVHRVLTPNELFQL